MAWIEIGDLEEIPRSAARVVHTGEGDIAVFRTADDEVFALRDRCYHRGGPLSQGLVFGRNVACPLHHRITRLDTGSAAPPDEGCTRRYPVQVMDGRVYVELEAEATAPTGRTGASL